MDAELLFGLQLADAADALTTARFQARDLKVDTKPDRSPVSDADRAVEECLRGIVARSGRGEGVQGEEFGDDGTDRKWIVDPIDGTTSFIRGVPIWGTLLALQVENDFVVGIASAPALRRRWWAVRGGGAFADGQAIRVSGVAVLEDAAVSTTSLRVMPWGWQEVVRRAWSERGLGDFWQHCLVAEGSLDVATDGELQVWDYSAPRLIVEEAGGRYTSFTGDALRPGGSGLSTNGLLHDELIELLARNP